MDAASMPQGPLPLKATRRLVVALASAACGLALLVLAGTLVGARTLAALGLGLVPMAPLAAAMVILLGSATLFLEARPRSWTRRWLAWGAVLLVALPCLDLVAAHLQGSTTALEGWLLRRWPALPRKTTSLPSAISHGEESPMGEPLATLPPSVPALRIGSEAKRCHSSDKAG